MRDDVLRITNSRNEPIIEGRIAIINGASSGIGRVIAESLLENGVCISATYNKNPGIIDQLKEKYGKPKIISFQIDFLSDNYEELIQKIINETKNQWGKIDILINISGIWLVKPFLYETRDEIEQVWRINYWAPYSFIKKTVPHMMEIGGQIVNIASTAGVKGSGHQVTYCASKAALINLTESLAEEFAARNIRINVISPGPTNTYALNKYLDETAKTLLVKRTPLNRLCEPLDVANAVLHILTNDYLTGVNVLLHGGRL